VYLSIIVGVNYLRRAILPEPGEPAQRVLLALAFSAALFIVITITYRVGSRRQASP
jgi:hypothetical protein